MEREHTTVHSFPVSSLSFSALRLALSLSSPPAWPVYTERTGRLTIWKFSSIDLDIIAGRHPSAILDMLYKLSKTTAIGAVVARRALATHVVKTASTSRPVPPPSPALVTAATSVSGRESLPTRHDWAKLEIQEIYDTPLLELVFRAASTHRKYHEPGKIQLCTLMNIKSV